MAKQTQLKTVMWLAALLCMAFLGLGYRLVDLQVLRHADLSAKAELNTQHEFVLEPRRGDILDVKGNLLATTVFVYRVCADPTFIGTNQVLVARALAPLLETNELALVQLLTPTLRRITNSNGATNVFGRYVRLKERLSMEAWAKVRTAMTNLDFGDEKNFTGKQKAFYQQLRTKSVYAEQEQFRVYSNQSLAAHVLGYTAAETREVDGKQLRILVGRDGIERTFDRDLAGVPGWRRTELDSHHREVLAQREQDVEARDGKTVVLTIDSVIQHIVENALADAMEKYSPLNASGIVVRPRTGEILAMATLPNYDPNDLHSASPSNLVNRVISLVAEPGSTFKIVVVSGALNDRVVQLSDTFDCEHGHWMFAGRKLHDHEPLDVLSVERIITKSSNIGAAKIGIKLGEQRLYDYIRAYGFGEATGIPLPAESGGIVRKLSEWKKVSVAQIPMGQGIAVTRLQMTMAMCALANNGLLMRPMLVDHVEDSDHHIAPCSPMSVRQVVSEATCRQMVQALKTVVSTQGTAEGAALEHYVVAGKTGTAQKPGLHGYTDKFFTSFIGFFPADHPELCISVTLDEPKGGHYGGKVAGPVFKQIAEACANYLNIHPEENPVPPGSEPSTPVVDASMIKTAAAKSLQN